MTNEAVGDGLAFIPCGSASQLPYEDKSRDITTANETIPFWPEISEIFRTLNKDGGFIIINKYPTEGSQWWKITRLKNEEDYNNAFQHAGLKKMTQNLKH